MIELNFGKSIFIKYSSPQTVETERDMIITVPEQGELKRLPNYVLEKLKHILDSKEAKVTISNLTPEKSRENFTAVEFSLKYGKYDKFHGYEDKIIMPWINQRGEWIAIHYEQWEESRPRDDEHYLGPFQLNEYCQKKILEAYGVSEELIKLENVPQTSPSVLEKIASGVEK